MRRNIVFINQTIGSLFIEVIKSFSTKYENIFVISGNRQFEEKNEDFYKNVYFDKIIRYNRTSTLKRLFSWVWGTIQILFKVIFKYRTNELFIVSNPPFSFFITLFCKNPYSILVYDVYPDILYEGNRLTENNIIIKWWKNKNIEIYKNALTIYTISNGMADCMSQYVERSKIKVIPNWADKSITPIKKQENKFIEKYSISGNFIVSYSGNIGNTHNVECLIEIATILKNEKDIVFVIIGEGGKKEKIRKLIEERKLENCLLLPYQPKEMLAHSLSAADIGVVTLDIKFSKLSVPSKTYNILAAGSALLCITGKDSELFNIINEYGVGMLYEPFQLEEMAEYLLKMKNNPLELMRYKENSIKASQYFTHKNAEKYVEEYKS